MPLPFPPDLSVSEACALQKELAARVERTDRLGPVTTVAGVDVSCDRHTGRVVAAACVIDARDHRLLEQATAEGTTDFPYVPGTLSFREVPVLIRALEALHHTPDLIVCDGHGLAHPRRFGLACHLGVLLDVPAIGCAKSRLCGDGDEPGPERGAREPLVHRGEVVGLRLRTRTGTRPVFVSTGHRVSLDTACAWILRLAPRYRLPETTRRADRLAGETLKAWKTAMARAAPPSGGG